MIRCWLSNLSGNLANSVVIPFTAFEGAQQVSVTIALNGGRSGSLSLSFDDEAGRHIRALSTVVNVEWDQGRLINGVVVRPQFQGRQRRIVIPIRDPAIRLQGFQVGAAIGRTFADLATGGPGDWEFAAQDQSEILANLAVDYPQVDMNGVWINTLERGSLTPSRTRDRTYEPGKQIWEAMQDLTRVIDGVDFDLRPNDAPGLAHAYLDTYYPMMGQDRTNAVVFEFGCGMNNCTECDIEEAGDLVRNRSIRVGQLNEATQVQPLQYEESTSSSVQYGNYTEYVGESDVVDEGTLFEHAEAAVRTFGFPIFFASLTPAQDDGSGYEVSGSNISLLPDRYGVPPVVGPQGDYWLGDIVRVIAKDGPSFQFDLAMRVIEITLTRIPTGATVVQLKLSPMRGGGYLIPGVGRPTFAREFAALREMQRLQGVVQ